MSTVDFTCTLPVVIQGKPQNGWTGGFVTFPGARYEPDPAGVLESIGDGEIGTQAQPPLYGYLSGSPFYDLALKRWLPTRAGQTSPDGSSYAFAAPPFGGANQPVIIVSVTTGASRTVNVTFPPPPGSGVGWQVADYDGRHVYLTANQIDQFAAGVWRLDPLTGVLDQMLPTSAGHVLVVRNGVAWVGQVNSADTSPPIAPKGQAFDTIASINLSTGAQTTWVYIPQVSIALVGVDDSDRPVVSIAIGPDFDTSHGTIALIPYPGAGRIEMATALPLFDMQPDAGRIWFGNDRGIYLWTQAVGLRKVFAFQGDPTLGQSIIPGGHCV